MEIEKLREMELLQEHRKEYKGLVEKRKKLEEAMDEFSEGLQEEIEVKDDTLNTYIVRDRTMNDELQEARKAALKVRTQALLSKKTLERSPSCSFIVLYQHRW